MVDFDCLPLIRLFVVRLLFRSERCGHRLYLCSNGYRKRIFFQTCWAQRAVLDRLNFFSVQSSVLGGLCSQPVNLEQTT